MILGSTVQSSFLAGGLIGGAGRFIPKPQQSRSVGSACSAVKSLLFSTAEIAEDAEMVASGIAGSKYEALIRANSSDELPFPVRSAVSACSAVKSPLRGTAIRTSLVRTVARAAQMHVNEVTEAVIGAAIAVHRAVGPGLLESAYEALSHELAERRLRFERQKALPVKYRGVTIGCGYRIDLLVERLVVVELKAINRIQPIHEAQLVSYLRLSGYPVGLLINFNVKQLRRGLRRFVNGLPE